MHSLADKLPPEIARQIHLDWRKNETAYWQVRDSLMAQYHHRWIAFAESGVIASGTSPVEVFHQAQQSGKHPFVVCVGREHEPTRMRRAEFAYDFDYPDEALPLVTVEFRTSESGAGILMERVIPDTGADASALPWSDCQQLQLDPAEGLPGLIGGVGGSSTATVVFLIWAYVDGRSFPCRLQADFHSDDRILGRDVLNRLDVLFRGPHGEVILNP